MIIKKVATLRGNGNSFAQLAFNSTGQIMATAEINPSLIHLWNTDMWEQGGGLEGHSAGTSSIAFASKENIFVSGGYDGTIKLWDIATETNYRTFVGNTKRIWSIQFSPSDNIIISNSLGEHSQIWNLDTGTLTRLINVPYSPNSISFSPDGKFLAVADTNRIMIQELKTGAITQEINDPLENFQQLTYSPNGNYLAVGSRDESFQLWNISTNTIDGKLGSPGQGAKFPLFSPSGNILACAYDWDTCIKFWDIETKQEVNTVDFMHNKVNMLNLTVGENRKAGKHVHRTESAAISGNRQGVYRTTERSILGNDDSH